MNKQKKPLFVRLIQYALGGVAGLLAMALILPFLIGFSGVITPRPNDTKADHTAHTLKNAISSYFIEYRKYPVPGDTSSDTQLQTDHALMDALFGADLEGAQVDLNPRRIAFYAGRRAKPMGNGRYRNGVTLEEGDKGELWDPWGNYYRVALDLDGDSQIANVDSRLEVEHLPGAILVWSAGPDGDFNTWKDNVTTW